MKIIIRGCVILSFLSMLSACANLPYNHLSAEARNQLAAVDVYLVVPQDEIYAQIDQSNVAAAGGGGLLLALIDAAVESSRTKSAEEIIQPVRDKMLNFDYADMLAGEINSALKSVTWLHAGDIQLLRSAEKDQLSDLYNKSRSSALLYITADYSLTSNFQAAVTKVSLALYPKTDSLSKYREREDKNATPTDFTDNIYRNSLESSTTVVSDSKKKKEEAAAEVAEASPGLLVDALTANARNIGRLIKEDIETGKTDKEK